MSDKKTDSTTVVDLERSRAKVQALRQDRAEAALAGRFHDAMGWQGKPKPATKKKSKKKKR